MGFCRYLWCLLTETTIVIWHIWLVVYIFDSTIKDCILLRVWPKWLLSTSPYYLWPNKIIVAQKYDQIPTSLQLLLSCCQYFKKFWLRFYFSGSSLTLYSIFKIIVIHTAGTWKHAYICAFTYFIKYNSTAALILCCVTSHLCHF